MCQGIKCVTRPVIHTNISENRETWIFGSNRQRHETLQSGESIHDHPNLPSPGPNLDGDVQHVLVLRVLAQANKFNTGNALQAMDTDHESSVITRDTACRVAKECFAI